MAKSNLGDFTKLKESGKHRIQEAVRRALLPTHFHRNMMLIFGDTRPICDTISVKRKTQQSDKRCAQLRRLDSAALASWAVAYPLHIWTGGRVGNVVFKELLRSLETSRDLEPLVRSWVSKTRQTGKLATSDFNDFVIGMSSP